MDLELRHLSAFVAVVDEGSFTAAADALHVSQASVSRAVAALEKTVGGSVLSRTTRELGLTELGSRILPTARRMLEDAEFVVGLRGREASDLRVGHAWAAIGRHTTTVQRQWSSEFPGSELVFVQSPTPSAGLAEGTVDAAVIRQPVFDRRLESTLIGIERRYAAVAKSDPLARRRSLTLHDFSSRTVAIDDLTGTTTLDMWPGGTAPTTKRDVRGVEDWLNVIAAGQAIGITVEATTHLYQRPDVVFRPVKDTEPVQIWLSWRSSDPPEHLESLTRLLRGAYAT